MLRAIVDIAKLRDYCLNFDHPRGRHKARVFAAALGLTAPNAQTLREALLAAACTYDATPSEQDAYGQRYVLDFTMSSSTGEAMSMTTTIPVLDVVALTEDLPKRGLYRGQVGTVVEELAPDVFEVEFSDNNGRAYATLALHAEQLMVLHYQPVEMA